MMAWSTASLTSGYLRAIFFLATVLQGALAIECYRCASNTPSCPTDQGLVECNRMDDKCVRLEQNLIGAEQGKKLYTMDCIGDMERSHTDLPRDKSIGCRVGEPQHYTLIGPAAALTPTSDELNTYCFCDTAEACSVNSALDNRSGSLVLPIAVILTTIVVTYLT